MKRNVLKEVKLLERMKKTTKKNRLKKDLNIDQLSNICFEEFVKKIEEKASNGDNSICAEREDIVNSKICKKYKLYQVKNYTAFVNEIYKNVLKKFENENFEIIKKRVPYTCNPIPKYLTYIEW